MKPRGIEHSALDSKEVNAFADCPEGVGNSDLELLVQAAREAEEAHARGLLGGPGMDEVQLRSAARRARCRDAERVRATRIATLVAA